MIEQLPLVPAAAPKAEDGATSWDYIYEPDAQTVLDESAGPLRRSAMYQAVAENMASEQSGAHGGDEAASDNART